MNDRVRRFLVVVACVVFSVAVGALVFAALGGS